MEELGYDWEEFGLVDGTLPVTREEFDDGATLVDGNPARIVGRAELRIRYITPYNFLLAPQMSPINNHDFDGQLEDLLNAMLQGEDVFGQLCESIERLPLTASVMEEAGDRAAGGASNDGMSTRPAADELGLDSQ